MYGIIMEISNQRMLCILRNASRLSKAKHKQEDNWVFVMQIIGYKI